MYVFLVSRLLPVVFFTMTWLSGSGGFTGPVHEIPFTVYENIIFVALDVNGTSATFIVDTGATVSLLDMEQADAYHFTCHESQGKGRINGLAGVNTLMMASGIRVRHKGVKIRGIKFYVCNIDSLHEFLEKRDIHILGIIGADFLIRRNAVIDYERKALLLKF